MPSSLAHPVDSELIIKKSRFIGRVEPCADRALALAKVAELRERHPGAVHVCWALLAGGQSAAHDDGEPGGTAGRPMLEVLRHQDLDAVLATVVRYWGGVKLGAGGLVRAYTDAVAQALLKADKVPLLKLKTLRCTLPYAMEGLLRRELEAAGAQLLEMRHGSQVELQFSLAEDAAAALVARLGESGQGRIGWLAPEGEAPAT
ncbi:IMPACT family protein [Paucibacter sp. M5-1]|uniref:IMPACT family protein n=1 Tax=Paucibacter sp. M5-1 TaxID=3015998 RepID=UPI0022B8E758|nr:YigZ family protein [Paucibacter sp. M5-1]MCZ7882196.1 IMPACT family protein [Paucibacter sp. M5-1]